MATFDPEFVEECIVQRPLLIALVLQRDERRMSEGHEVSSMAFQLPRNRPYQEIAERTCPSQPELSREITPEYIAQLKVWSRIQFKRLIQKLTRQWKLQQVPNTPAPRTKVYRWGEQDFCLRKDKPISNEIRNPTPMPVKMEKPDRFDESFAIVRQVCQWDQWDQRGVDKPVVKDETSYGVQEYFDLANMAVYADRRVDLCKRGVGPRSIGALMDALKDNKFFEHFLFGNNVSGRAGADAIADYLRRGSKFRTWYLAGNDFDAECMRVLCQALKGSDAVRALWLKRNPIRPEGAPFLADYLSVNRTLTLLDVDNCGLLDEGMNHLCLALADHPTLLHLYASGNGITAEGARSLFPVLAAEHCRLESLFLCSNRLGDDGAAALAVGLLKNRSLVRLMLSSNRIESVGAGELAVAVATHPSLHTLGLGLALNTDDLGELPNRIGAEGAHALGEMLMKNPRIRVLTLDRNGLDATTLNIFASLACAHPGLLYLHLGEENTPMDPQVRQGLMRSMQTNVKRTHGADMDYSTFLRYHLHDYRNVPEIAHIRSIYRTAQFTRQGRRHMVKRWPDNAIKIEET